MSTTLPKNWTITKIKVISDLTTGDLDANAAQSDGIYPFFTCSDEISKINNYAFNQEAILLAGNGSFAVKWFEGKFNAYQRTYVITPTYIDGKYLYYYLHSKNSYFHSVSRGSTIKYLRIADIHDLDVPYPPIKEQKSIVDKIDELFSELDNGIEELETAQKKLGLYRQSLLKSAVEGELSKEWRESQTEVSETGEQLLARILKERRERWEQEKLKEFAEKGKNPPKNWQEKYPEPVQPDTKNLPQLPEGWVWATLDSLSYLITSGSRGWGQYYSDSGSLFIRAQNIKNDVLNYEDIAYVQLPLNTEGLRTKVDELDILITITGANVAKTALVEVVLDEAYINQHISLVKLIDKTISYYVHLYLINEFGGRKQLLDVAYGAGKPGLNLSQVANTHIPLPNTNEINFIVDLLKLKLEEVSETQIQNLNLIKKTSLQKTNILDKAFSGNLISQDPNDEPAQVLLERIQQQRETEALVKKATPKKRSTQKVKKEIGMSKTILEILQQQSDWISGQDLATAFGLNGNSKIEEIEQFYEQLRTLSLDEKILVKPDQQNKKEQDLIKLKDKTDAS